MSLFVLLCVGFDSDNDVYVSVWDDFGGGSIEFCCFGVGGGSLFKICMVLIVLMWVMEVDNVVFLYKDWWVK